jgi:hypothetical protein
MYLAFKLVNTDTNYLFSDETTLVLEQKSKSSNLRDYLCMDYVRKGE